MELKFHLTFKNMKNNWWKILGIILLLYAFLFGVLTPLKPGLPSVYPINGQAGSTITLNISGYNTHFDETDQQRVWLKLADKSLLALSLIHI